MKYHDHIIKIVSEDLGESDPKLNRVYEIYDQQGELRGITITLNNAKEYIDTGYDDNVLPG